MSNEFTRKSFTPDDEVNEQIKSWYIPVVEDSTPVPETTNAMGKRIDWVYEPPEEEPEEPKPPTLEEIEEIRQNAYEEGLAQGKEEGHTQGLAQGIEEGTKLGHEEGFAQGHSEGLTAGDELLQQKAASWDGNLHQLLVPLEQVNNNVEKQLVELAAHLANAIVHVEVQTNEAVIKKALKEAMDALPINQNQYVIRMHPDDISLIKEMYSEEQIEKKRWFFQEDFELSLGGCEVSTQLASVDMTIEQRRKDILDNFLLQAGIDND